MTVAQSRQEYEMLKSVEAPVVESYSANEPTVYDVTSPNFKALIFNFLINSLNRVGLKSTKKIEFMLISYTYFEIKRYALSLSRTYELLYSTIPENEPSLLEYIILENYIEMNSAALVDLTEKSSAKNPINRVSLAKTLKYIRAVKGLKIDLAKIVELKSTFYESINKEKKCVEAMITLGDSIFKLEREFEQKALELMKQSKFNMELIVLYINFKVNIRENRHGISNLIEFYYSKFKQIAPKQFKFKKRGIIDQITDHRNVIIMWKYKQSSIRIFNATLNAAKVLKIPESSILNKAIEDFMPTDIKLQHHKYMHRYLNQHTEESYLPINLNTFILLHRTSISENNYVNAKGNNGLISIMPVQIITKLDYLHNDDIYFASLMIPKLSILDQDSNNYNYLFEEKTFPFPVASATMDSDQFLGYDAPKNIFNRFPILIEILNLIFSTNMNNIEHNFKKNQSSKVYNLFNGKSVMFDFFNHGTMNITENYSGNNSVKSKRTIRSNASNHSLWRKNHLIQEKIKKIGPISTILEKLKEKFEKRLRSVNIDSDNELKLVRNSLKEMNTQIDFYAFRSGFKYYLMRSSQINYNKEYLSFQNDIGNLAIKKNTEHASIMDPLIDILKYKQEEYFSFFYFDTEFLFNTLLNSSNKCEQRHYDSIIANEENMVNIKIQSTRRGWNKKTRASVEDHDRFADIEGSSQRLSKETSNGTLNNGKRTSIMSNNQNMSKKSVMINNAGFLSKILKSRKPRATVITNNSISSRNHLKKRSRNSIFSNVSSGCRFSNLSSVISRKIDREKVANIEFNDIPITFENIFKKNKLKEEIIKRKRIIMYVEKSDAAHLKSLNLLKSKRSNARENTDSVNIINSFNHHFQKSNVELMTDLSKNPQQPLKSTRHGSCVQVKVNKIKDKASNKGKVMSISSSIKSGCLFHSIYKQNVHNLHPMILVKRYVTVVKIWFILITVFTIAFIIAKDTLYQAIAENITEREIVSIQMSNIGYFMKLIVVNKLLTYAQILNVGDAFQDKPYKVHFTSMVNYIRKKIMSTFLEIRKRENCFRMDDKINHITVDSQGKPMKTAKNLSSAMMYIIDDYRIYTSRIIDGKINSLGELIHYNHQLFKDPDNQEFKRLILNIESIYQGSEIILQNISQSIENNYSIVMQSFWCWFMINSVLIWIISYMFLQSNRAVYKFLHKAFGIFSKFEPSIVAYQMLVFDVMKEKFEFFCTKLINLKTDDVLEQYSSKSNKGDFGEKLKPSLSGKVKSKYYSMSKGSRLFLRKYQKNKKFVNYIIISGFFIVVINLPLILELLFGTIANYHMLSLVEILFSFERILINGDFHYSSYLMSHPVFENIGINISKITVGYEGLLEKIKNVEDKIQNKFFDQYMCEFPEIYGIKTPELTSSKSWASLDKIETADYSDFANQKSYTSSSLLTDLKFKQNVNGSVYNNMIVDNSDKELFWKHIQMTYNKFSVREAMAFYKTLITKLTGVSSLGKIKDFVSNDEFITSELLGDIIHMKLFEVIDLMVDRFWILHNDRRLQRIFIFLTWLLFVLMAFAYCYKKAWWKNLMFDWSRTLNSFSILSQNMIDSNHMIPIIFEKYIFETL